jgi:hypothetical protein
MATTAANNDDGFETSTGEHSTVLNSTNNNPDSVAADFATYEDYLDAQITPLDLYYLEDKDLARQLVELGYRGQGEPVKRVDFEARKRGTVKQPNNFRPKTPAGDQATISVSANENSVETAANNGEHQLSPFLKALQEREEPLRQGRLSSILFLRFSTSKNGGGHEVSGYIDLGDRLSQETFDKFYSGEQTLIPRIGDLSYYNWDTGKCQVNESGYFQVISENKAGLLFRNKRDRKIIRVDPKAESTEETARVPIKSQEYLQVVFYDHIIRRKL